MRSLLAAPRQARTRTNSWRTAVSASLALFLIVLLLLLQQTTFSQSLIISNQEDLGPQTHAYSSPLRQQATSSSLLSTSTIAPPNTAPLRFPTQSNVFAADSHHHSNDNIGNIKEVHPPLGPAVHNLLPSWGYAAPRNPPRWALMSQSLQDNPHPSWAVRFGPSESSHPVEEQSGTVRRRHSLAFLRPETPRIVDFGADQGFFTLSAAQFMAQSYPQAASVDAFAVEKGGFGGSFWAAEAMMKRDANRTVLHIIANQSRALKAAQLLSSRIDVHICRRTLNRSLLEWGLSPRCASSTRALSPRPEEDANPPRQSLRRASIAFLLSMLHWVDGVDGPSGLRDAICGVARHTDVTFVELPHPLAKKTFGVKRYRSWFKPFHNNVSALMRWVASTCHRVSSTPSRAPPPSSGEVQTSGEAAVTVQSIGTIPWGDPLLRLHRELFRLDRHDAIRNENEEDNNPLRRIDAKSKNEDGTSRMRNEAGELGWREEMCFLEGCEDVS